MSKNLTLKVAKRPTGSVPRTNEKTGEKYRMHFYYVLPSSDKLAVEQYKQDSIDGGYQPIYDGDGEFGTNTGLLLMRSSQFIPMGCDMKRITITSKVTGLKKDVWNKADELWQEINDAKKAGYDSDAEELIKTRDNLANARKKEIAMILAQGTTVVEPESDDDIDPFG